VRRFEFFQPIAVLTTARVGFIEQRPSSETLTPPSPRSQILFLSKLLSGRNRVFLDILSGPNG